MTFTPASGFTSDMLEYNVFHGWADCSWFGPLMTSSAHSTKTIPCLPGGLPNFLGRLYHWPGLTISSCLPSSAPWRCPGSSTSSSSLGLPSPASLGSESYAQQLHFIFCGYAQAFYTTLTHGQGRGCMAHTVQLMASSCSRVTVAFREGSAQDLGGTGLCAITGIHI